MPVSRHLTFKVITHDAHRVCKFHLSKPSLWGILALVTAGILSLSFYGVGYYTKCSQEVKLAAMRSENAELRDRVKSVQKTLDHTHDRVDDFSKTDRVMRSWTGLPEPGEDVRKMGVGGFADPSPPWGGKVSAATSRSLMEIHWRMDQILREARFLSASFDSIGILLGRDEALRRHTPSILPVSPDAGCWTSSRFGYRTDPFTGQRRFHNGIDLACHMGTPILATADGVVGRASLGLHRHLGFYIAIDHGHGFRTVYGHLRRMPTLKVGQTVKRGEVIGEMGKSGKATAPHVHYAISVDGRAANPKRYIFYQRGVSPVF